MHGMNGKSMEKRKSCSLTRGDIFTSTKVGYFNIVLSVITRSSLSREGGTERGPTEKQIEMRTMCMCGRSYETISSRRFQRPTKNGRRLKT